MTVIIPKPTKQIFQGNINHPDLYLWDSWSYIESNVIHLYCLAINRKKENGTPLLETERNNYQFHVRHFTSKDDGITWIDEGCFQKPGQTKSGHDSRNVWSGSISLMPDGKKLVAYTGLYQVDSERIFLQNIALASSIDGSNITSIDQTPLSCPVRDRKKIMEQGYYLDDAEKLGHKDGENDGPIMCWRDPFIFVDKQDEIHLFWSAKSTKSKGVVAHCLIEETENGYQIKKQYPPINLPDSELFTQAELPKIYFDDLREVYYMLVSTCSRISENQPDDEVEKKMRLYRSQELNGPWKCATEKESFISGSEELFGMSILRTEFEKNRAFCISPYIETGNPSTSLTISAPFYLNFSSNSI